ncbi:MAG TPA: GDSL-type esterase/lipase family protein [Myxococcota bacterium]|nr:GDSL-type esterase/lipase family protein [Myxococcota bacterium]
MPGRSLIRLAPFAALALAAAAASLPGARPAQAATLRVMAFGDSLTMGQGSTHQAGYRLAFLERLRGAGYDVDMLGRYHHGPEGIDGDHEGYQGRGVAKLDEVSFGAIRRDHPDAILLMIGTNDAKSSTFQPDAFRIRYSVLLDRFLAESKVRLVVSTIPPSRYGSPKRDRVKVAVNKVIREEVEKQRAAGKRIALIDAYHLLDADADFADTLHMDDEGYAKIGHAFADALLELLAKFPPPPEAPAEEAGAPAAPAAAP